MSALDILRQMQIYGKELKRGPEKSICHTVKWTQVKRKLTGNTEKFYEFKYYQESDTENER